MALRTSLRRLRTLDSSASLGKSLGALQSVDSSLLKPGILDQISELGKDTKQVHLVLTSDDANTTNPIFTGGKGSSLAALNTIKGVSVPHFFCVTTEVFKKVLSGTIEPILEELQSLSAQHQKKPDQDQIEQLFEVAKQMRERICATPIGEELEEKITLAYKRLCEQCGASDVPVAVRSSATTEDLAEASFAGQHDSFLNQCGIQGILSSISKCWASLFTDRAVEYRNRNNIPHAKAEMCVVVQQMVEPVVAGTSFSVEISTSFPAMHIAATYGLGEAVVSGDVTCDEWLLEPTSLRVIKQVIGSKEFELRKLKNGSGIEALIVDPEKRKVPSLSYVQIKQVAQVTLTIKNFYKQLYGYNDIDTEFAFDANGNLKMLQSRPLVEMNFRNVSTVDVNPGDAADVLVKGAYSLLGAVHGKVKVITDFDDLVNGLVKVEQDDIIFTTKTGNYWNQYLTNLKGIVTIEGSPTAHPMLIGRERGLPVICGISGLGLLRQISEFNGKWVTLDGLNKTVYLGKKGLKQASADQLFEQFSPVTPADYPSDDASLSFLKDFNRVHQDESSNWWVFNPNSKLNRVWQQLLIDMFPERIKIVNSCRKNQVKDPFNSSVKVYDDKARSN